MNSEKRKFTILIIDDEKPILNSMKKYFEAVTDHKVIGCSNALDAIEIIRNVNIDIIFSDINMPKLTGIELLKIIKKLPEGKNIDVIIMTGYSTKENAISSLRFGASEYLEKPFSFEEASFILSNIIENKIVKEENIKLKELESENKWFLDVMSIISHELKTPLTIISGNTSIMLEEILGKINPKQKKALSAINNGCSRLTKIIDSYFEYKKLNSHSLNLQNLSYYKYVEKFMKYFTDHIKNERSDIKFSYSLNIKPELKVNIEPIRTLEMTLNELIMNSCRNTRNGEITVNIYNDDKKIYTEVKDNGNGISKEFTKNIFHPGKSGKKDTLHSSVINSFYEYGKSGYYIGLSKCKKYLSFLDGQIYFNSIPNEETIFTYTLPIISEKKESA